MKQQDNNIDVFFRSGVENSTLELDKKKAWKKLENKRSKKRIELIVSIAVALVCIGIFLTIPTKKTDPAFQISNEFYKRQKLEEYEKKLSGTYEETILCYDCNNEFINPQYKQVPEEQWILKSN